jgi:hypothetical protein
MLRACLFPVVRLPPALDLALAAWLVLVLVTWELAARRPTAR